MCRCHVFVLVSWFTGKTVQLPSSTVNSFKTTEIKADIQLFPELAGLEAITCSTH
jgi:hypothetical protein